jgi:stage II sporulation protein D
MKSRRIGFYVFFIVALIAAFFIIIKLYDNKMIDKNMNRGQFAKALALCLYTEEECQTYEKNYFEEDNKDWYVPYMNKLYNQSYLDSHQITASKKSAEKNITYSEMEDVIGKLNINPEDILKIIDKHDDEDKVKTSDFKEIYDILISYLDTGKSIQVKKINIVKVNTEGDAAGVVNTSGGDLSAKGLDLSDYVDYEAQAYIKGSEIIFISSVTDKSVTYTNAYIESYEDGKLCAFINGAEREFKVKGVDDSLKDCIADIQIEDKKLTKLSLKKDTISGKVLAIDNSGVEIEKYAKLSFTDDFKVYKNYGSIKMQDFSKILVGYDTTIFVVADGKICAAIVTKDIDAQNIRVLLKTSGYAGLFHSKVVVTCAGSFTVTYGDATENFAGGQQLEITSGCKYLNAGRVKIVPDDTNNKLSIPTISRSYGTPAYRGSIEVAAGSGGLVVVNELPLEEYLYSVIPSEMPVSYGLEALYVQAVCARTYAYKELFNNSYSQYGAHVDDSVSFQVYNNVEETDLSIEAAKETYGKILTYNDEAIEAFFFSTSDGSTTNSTVWGYEDLPYTKGRLLTDDDTQLDLTDLKTFDSFIREDYDTFDSQFPWYRWNCTISLDALTKSINNTIGSRYAINPDNILTLQSDGSYASESISSIGTLQKMEITERGTGGVISKLILHGSDKTVMVTTEGNVRNLISVYGVEIHRKDGSIVDTNSTLPSAYFTLDEVKENGALTGYKFIGGGFGHGVGVSQNAVKAMTEAGMKWEDILKYFYTGITISDM